MIGVEVAARGFAFAAAVLLFGASLFLLYAPHDAFRAAGRAGADEWRRLRRAVWRIQVVCVAAAIISSMAWLVVQAAIIAGEPAPGSTLITVTQATLFGRVAALRLCLMLLLGAVVAWQRRERDAARALDIVTVVLAGVVLAAMAWMGHAVATLGTEGRIHLGADVVHLLAAGAWIGGLLPLAVTLGRARGAALPAEIAAQTTHRFSRLGIFCVAALIATGTVNAWFLVARLDALFATPYGRLLLLKLALFVWMLVLASRNRVSWTPQIATHTEAAQRSAALRRLARNARIEVGLGLAIVLVVGALGMMIPAAHTDMVGPMLPAPGAHVH